MERLVRPVAKFQLESICIGALNKVPRVRKVVAVKLGRSPVGTVNWTFKEVEPRFHIDDVRQSHSVIRDLQREFRMVTSGGIENV